MKSSLSEQGGSGSRTTTLVFIAVGCASLAGFCLFVILHNVFYALGEVAPDVPVPTQVLVSLEHAFFNLAVFVCPAGVLIGAVGSAVMAVVHFRRKRASEETP